MRVPFRTAIVAVSLSLLAASCSGDDDSESEPEDDEAIALAASVDITSPVDGALVPATFTAEFAAEGLDIAPGGAHFVVAVDAVCQRDDKTLPEDTSYRHLHNGDTTTELTLTAGEHTLCLHAADASERSTALTDQITVRIDAAGGATPEASPTPGVSIETWEGTFEGEITWDCGPAGRRTGKLEGTFVLDLVSTRANGDPVAFTSSNTITGSCAGATTGELTTPISMGGELTQEGIVFRTNPWQAPGPLIIRLSGASGVGRLQGEVPGPGTLTLDFAVECGGPCR